MTTNLLRVPGALLLGMVLMGASVLPSGAAAATVPSATIDPVSLATEKTKPSLGGGAQNLKSVRYEIADASGKRLYRSKELRVRDERWKGTSSKKLKAGSYAVVVYDAKDKTKKTLAKGTLVIGGGTIPVSKAPKSDGIISVSALPLLAGGVANQGTSVPVAYLKVQNATGSAVNLEGFTLKQNGSAAGTSVIGFSTSDDKGGSRATVGGIEGVSAFKAGSAYVPLAATILPNQVRIFTIKAQLSRNAGADLGKQLYIDVIGVTANGTVRAGYPIHGATWVIAR